VYSISNEIYTPVPNKQNSTKKEKINTYESHSLLGIKLAVSSDSE